MKRACTILNQKQSGNQRDWYHANSPKKKKYKSAPSAGKVMAAFFFFIRLFLDGPFRDRIECCGLDWSGPG
jgi:hypothetical protein